MSKHLEALAEHINSALLKFSADDPSKRMLALVAEGIAEICRKLSSDVINPKRCERCDITWTPAKGEDLSSLYCSKSCADLADCVANAFLNDPDGSYWNDDQVKQQIEERMSCEHCGCTTYGKQRCCCDAAVNEDKLAKKCEKHDDLPEFMTYHGYSDVECTCDDAPEERGMSDEDVSEMFGMALFNRPESRKIAELNAHNAALISLFDITHSKVPGYCQVAECKAVGEMREGTYYLCDKHAVIVNFDHLSYEHDFCDAMNSNRREGEARGRREMKEEILSMINPDSAPGSMTYGILASLRDRISKL